MIRSRMITALISASAITTLCYNSASCYSQVYYDVLALDLATPESNSNSAKAINSIGECAGYSGYYAPGGKSSDINAVKWLADGSVQIFSPGNNLFAEAYDLNDSGVAVGVNSDRLAVVWESGQEILIGNLDEEGDGIAYGINNAGEVVGNDERQFLPGIAFFWSSDDGIQALPMPDSSESSSAKAINDHGEIAGYFNSMAVYWPSKNDQPVILGSLGETPAVAYDINESSQIVGYSSVPGSGFPRAAFIWQDGVMTELPRLPGTTYAIAYAINNRGQIVGTSLAPVMWYNGEIIDLRLLVPDNVTLYSVYDINDRGQICGDAMIEGEEYERAVLLTPRLTVFAPEPGIAGTVNTITIDGGTPDQRVILIAGLQTGATDIPGCPGLIVGIDSPRLLGTTIINSFGLAEFTQYVPGYASGRTVHLAAVEPVTCRVSETITHTFP